MAEIRCIALEIVEADGFDGLTMARLALALDLSVGALYRYHASKDALVADLQAAILRRWSGHFEEMIARCAALDVQDQAVAALLPIAGAALLYSELPLAEPGPFALMSRILGDPRPLVADEVAAAVVLPAMAELLGAVAALIEAAVGAALDPAPAPPRAIQLFGAVHGVIQLRKLQRLAPAGMALDGLVPGLVGDLLRGWGAPWTAISEASSALSALTPFLSPEQR